jgi:thymidylate synthase (FAD)
MSKIEVRLNPDVTPAGSDLSIVNAARRSFNTRSEWEKVLEPQAVYEVLRLKPKDKRLLEFLARGMTADDFHDFVLSVGDNGLDWLYWLDDKVKNKLIKLLWQWRNTPTHDTPFNHTFISFEVKAPIFVRAQLVKHEYLILSEFSRRYITDSIEFYEPDYWRKAADNKKQGSLEEPVYSEATLVSVGYDPHEGHTYKELNEIALGVYKDLLSDGVAPEQVRMVLPQSAMTEWTWSGTLGAFAKMCTLRLHPEAQYEARIVAKEVYKHLQDYYPVAAKALVEGPDVPH